MTAPLAQKFLPDATADDLIDGQPAREMLDNVERARLCFLRWLIDKSRRLDDDLEVDDDAQSP